MSIPRGLPSTISRRLSKPTSCAATHALLSAALVHCARQSAKTLSKYGAEKHQRNSISVFVEPSDTLDSRLFSAGASLLLLVLEILVRALNHATRLRWTFSCDSVSLSVNRCTLTWSQDLRSSVNSLKTWAARSPEIFNPIVMNIQLCHRILVTFCFGFWLDCSSACWCLLAHFLPYSLQDVVVQLPFRYSQHCDRECFFDGLRAKSFFSNFFLQSFHSAVSRKRWSSWSFHSLFASFRISLSQRCNKRLLDSVILSTHSF